MPDRVLNLSLPYVTGRRPVPGGMRNEIRSLLEVPASHAICVMPGTRKLHFPSHRVVNIASVIRRIVQRLPPGVRFEQGRPVNFRPWFRKDGVA